MKIVDFKHIPASLFISESLRPITEILQRHPEDLNEALVHTLYEIAAQKLSDEMKCQIAQMHGVPFRHEEKLSADGKTITATMTSEIPFDVQFVNGRITLFTNPNLRE